MIANPLEETHVALHINIFDQAQQVLVRRHLTVERLIADILREFALELDLNRKYILVAGGRQLDPETIIGEAGLESKQELILGYYEPVRAMTSTQEASAIAIARAESSASSARAPSAPKAAMLREVESGTSFALRRTATTIGRSAGDGVGVDIDLQGFSDGKSVSRAHARVVTEEGKHYVEPLKEDRPVYVNSDEVTFGTRRLLKSGDIINLGRMNLAYEG
jgi:hypothetical protein